MKVKIRQNRIFFMAVDGRRTQNMCILISREGGCLKNRVETVHQASQKRGLDQQRLPDEVISGEFGSETARQASPAGRLGQQKLPDEAISKELRSEIAW